MTPLPLVLAIGNFAIGFGAFVPVGILTPIGLHFGTAPDVTGRVMTAYAIAYALASPLLIAASGRLRRRVVLGGGLALFMAGMAASALAASFEALLAARVLGAFGAGLFTPSAAAVVVATSPPERRAWALSVTFAGLTMAQVLGVPAGTWLGYAFGWPVTFWVAAAIGALAAALVLWTVPRDVPFQATSLSALRRTLAEPRTVFAVTFTATFISAIYVNYTYLGPLLETRLGVGRDGVSLYLLVFGIAAVIGNLLGGWLSDRVGPNRTLLALALCHMVLQGLLPLPLWDRIATGLLIAAWSAAGWSFMSPQQARLIAIAPQAAAIVLALNASCIYVGVALGSALGGAALKLGGFDLLAPVAALASLAAVLHLVLSNQAVSAAGAPSR